MASPKKINTKKMLDVTPPGSSAPSNTSRPVLISNRPLIKDPMMNAGPPSSETKVPEAAAPETTRSESSLPHKDMILQPIDADEVPEKSASEQPADPTIAELADKANNNSTEENPQESPPEPDTEVSPPRSETKSIKTAIDPEAEDKAKAEHAAAIQKLVDSKKYVLPINAVEKRRTKRVVLFGILLSVLLAVAWVDIALDASLIQLGGINPVTHFFNN